MRENLRPVFQRLPKVLLLWLMVMAFPLYLAIGAMQGIREFCRGWWLEFQEIFNMTENEQ